MAKRKVLIIDDDPDILDVVDRILRKSGYDTVTACSGKEGIRQAAATQPDLVLCDMMMETVDAGMDAARAIKDERPSTPILLMSSIAESSANNFDLQEQGFAGILQKPIDPQAVIKIVGAALCR